MLYPNCSSKISTILKNMRSTPFVHNGRSLSEGMDCLGFIQYFYSEFGVALPDTDGSFIPKNWFRSDPDRLTDGFHALGFPYINKAELHVLDLVLFSIYHPAITHTGVLISPKQFMHMSPSSGCIVSRFERHWYRHCRGGFRILT